MAKWIVSIVALIGAVMPLRGASVRSDNFIVEAPTKAMAEEFSALAEKFRKEKAVEWLGKEMPNWRTPCPLKIIVDPRGGAEGATTFNFEHATQEMFIKGSLNRMKDSVLPHEITHTVFAHHFRQPVPRWADEGGSVYSEDDLERRRHDKMSVQYLNAGQAFELRALFALKDYPKNPRDQMILYAEGYSISRYLIELSDRQTFLNFVADGMRGGWEKSVQKHYDIKSVKSLETQWLDHLRATATGDAVTAQPRKSAEANLASRDPKSSVRQSSSAMQPQLDPLPVARGQSPSTERTGDEAGWNSPRQRFFETAPAQYPTKIQGNMKEDPILPPPAVLLPPELDR